VRELVALALLGLWSAACGGDGQLAVDATEARIDATVRDGPLSDAELGTASVRIDIGGPIAGVTVAFHDGSGAIVELATTDDDGQATGSMSPAGMVTYHTPELSAEGTLYTVMGVQPGDLIVHESPTSLGWDLAGYVTVSLPGAVAGADTYDIRTGSMMATITDPATPATIRVYEHDRAADGTVDVLAAAYAADAPDDVLAHASKRDIAHTSGATTTVVLTAWQTEFLDISVGASNLPETALEFYGVLSVYEGGRFYGQSTSATVPVVSGEATVAGTVEAGFGDSTAFVAEIGHSAANSYSRYREQRTGVASVEVSGADFLPVFLSAELSPDNEDPSQYSASWEFDRPVADADGCSIQIRRNNFQYLWRIFLPADRSSLVFPSLPDEYASYLPDDTAEIWRAFLYEESDRDWNAIRARPGSIMARRLEPGTVLRYSRFCSWPACQPE